MRLLALVLALTCVPAAAAATSRERAVAGPISTVGLAGVEVVYADSYTPRCHEIRLWNVTTRADRRLASHCFVATSTGSGVAAATVSGGRALWLTYTGGNIREWSLWTKAGTAKVRRIRLATADVDGPPPVVLGRAWEGSLPYAAGRTIVVLHPNGSRRFTLTVADRVEALSAHSRGYAAVLSSGAVLTISPAGRVVRERSFQPGFVESAVLAGPGLVVKTRNGLEIHGNASVRTIPLPAGARFLGLSEGTFAYGSGVELRLRGHVSGSDRLFRRLAPGFHAELGRRGIVYGSGRTLGFAVRANL